MMTSVSKAWNFSPALTIAIFAFFAIGVLIAIAVIYATVATARVDRMRANVARAAMARFDSSLLSLCTTHVGIFAGPARMPARQDSIAEHMTGPATIAGHARARA
jgi:hypothetical protein